MTCKYDHLLSPEPPRGQQLQRGFHDLDCYPSPSDGWNNLATAIEETAVEIKQAITNTVARIRQIGSASERSKAASKNGVISMKRTPWQLGAKVYCDGEEVTKCKMVNTSKGYAVRRKENNWTLERVTGHIDVIPPLAEGDERLWIEKSPNLLMRLDGVK